MRRPWSIPASYAAAVDEILADPALGQRMGDAAAVRSHRYAWSYTAARLRRLYSDLSVRALVSCP